MNCPRCGKTAEEHEAGRCLDAWVAEKVMEWEIKKIKGADGVTRKYWIGETKRECWQWNPSEKKADALEVVEKLEAHPNHVLFSCSRKSGIRGKLIWSVVFREVLSQQHDYYTEANDLPLAICRAALMASKEE